MQFFDFMRDGGFVMWAMVATAIGFGAAAFAQPSRRQARLQLGAAVVGAEGLLGMALGMKAVAHYMNQVPAAEAGKLVAVGLGELANNGILAAVLALGLLVAAQLPWSGGVVAPVGLDGPVGARG